MRSVSSSESGQTLVIIVMVMVVALTVGLAVATRSITTLRQSTQTSASEKAYHGAEAAIEYALSLTQAQLEDMLEAGGSFYCIEFSPCSFPLQEGDVTVNYYAAPLAADEEIPVDQGKVWQVSLEGFIGSALEVSWPDNASIEVIFVNTANPPVLSKFAFNGYGVTQSNGFAGADNSGDGRSWVTLDSGDGLDLTKMRFMRIRPYYNNATISVSSPGGGTLPFQGFSIIAKGESAGSVRKIKATRTLPALPSIFDFALYSGGTLTK